MKTRTKIRIDHFVGPPICFLFNAIARVLAFVLRRNHEDDPEHVKRIVIQKFFGMGSILRATPTIRAIRKRYPEAEIVFVTAKRNSRLIERLPNIDRILYVDDRSISALMSTTLRLIVRMWMARVDLYFDLEVYSTYSTLIETLSCARNRYGFYRKSTGFRMGLHTKLVFFNTHRHISEIYAQLAEACHAKLEDMTMDRILIQKQDEDEFHDWASTNLKDKKYLVVNPNSSDLMLERRWAVEHFIHFINQFANYGDEETSIVLMGAPAECEFVSNLYDRLSEKAKKITLNAAGKLSLGAVFALIDSALLLVTADSGPYHFASSLGKPTISLWGPTSPSHYSLRESRDMIFYKNVYCSPCLYHADDAPCKGNNICMKMIQPSEVLARTLEFLGIDTTIEMSGSSESDHHELGIVTR